MTHEAWSSAERYERFMGRWSRALAVEVVSWLDPAPGLRWLDVGCGTGALTTAILRRAVPSSVIGVDPSAAYVALAAEQEADSRATFRVGSADQLPVPDSSTDMAACGLVLNFVPDPSAAITEMRRVLAPGGAAVAYVWDYAAGMQMLRRFWDAAIAEDPAVSALDESSRAICAPGGLEDCFRASGMEVHAAAEIDIPTEFADFDDYWTPFLGGQGAAGSFCASLSEAARVSIRERLRASLPVSPDGAIRLRATARAVVGTAR